VVTAGTTVALPGPAAQEGRDVPTSLGPDFMSLADYLALSDRVNRVRSRDDAVDMVASLDRANLHPVDRRVLARRLARVARTIDPGLTVDLGAPETLAHA
jgi:hypothetical protein